MSSKKYIIESGLGQEVLNYLVSKPFSEVSDLVKGMTALTELPEPEVATTDIDE